MKALMFISLICSLQLFAFSSFGDGEQIIHDWGTNMSSMHRGMNAFNANYPLMEEVRPNTLSLCKGLDFQVPRVNCCPKGETCPPNGSHIAKVASIPEFPGGTRAHKSCVNSVQTSFLSCLVVLHPNDGRIGIDMCVGKHVLFEFEGIENDYGKAAYGKGIKSCCGSDQKNLSQGDQALCDWARREWAGTNYSPAIKPIQFASESMSDEESSARE